MLIFLQLYFSVVSFSDYMNHKATGSGLPQNLCCMSFPSLSLSLALSLHFLSCHHNCNKEYILYIHTYTHTHSMYTVCTYNKWCSWIISPANMWSVMRLHCSVCVTNNGLPSVWWMPGQCQNIPNDHWPRPTVWWGALCRAQGWASLKPAGPLLWSTQRNPC